MEKDEFRVLIKHNFLKGKTAKETKDKLDRQYGESAPSNSMVKDWFAAFKRGRTSTKTTKSPGRPNEVTTSEMIEKIYKIVLEDRKVKVREITNMVNISTERVYNILHEHLQMKKLCARWVPRFLTIDQKQERVDASKRSLEMFQRNKKEFLRRFITVDETWIHYYTPESKENAKEWLHTGSNAPKRPRTQQSAGKVMATVFWDKHGVILVDYLQKGKTITGVYYAALLDQLKLKIKEKRPHLANKKVLFHQDNAPAHKSLIVMAKLYELHYELLSHPPYSPDLAPSDFFLFPNLKRWLCGRKFGSNSEVIDETNAYFAGFQQSYYTEGIKKLESRWTRCIELKGEYVEK